ncbi:MAG: sigma-E processing peptidase SpoIIGA [Clostridia bacterium]|nr:sigma-E processing peptidase SpoIIGA [Clostridia bacterium]
MRVSIWLYILEQTSLTSCLLLAIGLSVGLRRRAPVRLIAVSAVTAALSALMAQAPAALRVVTLLCSAVAAPLLAWPCAPKRIWLRMIAAGSFLSLGMTGLMRFMQPFGWPAAFTVLLACAALRAVPVVVPKPEETPRLATVDIRHGPHHLTLTALIDSGNLLRDGVTGLPVIIISRRAAQRLVQLPPAGSLTYPFRLLTVRTVSGTGMMTVFHPDSVCLLLPDGWMRVETLLGVSPEGYDGFQALVPSCLMRQEAGMPDARVIRESEFS